MSSRRNSDSPTKLPRSIQTQRAPGRAVDAAQGVADFQALGFSGVKLPLAPEGGWGVILAAFARGGRCKPDAQTQIRAQGVGVDASAKIEQSRETDFQSGRSIAADSEILDWTGRIDAATRGVARIAEEHGEILDLVSADEPSVSDVVEDPTWQVAVDASPKATRQSATTGEKEGPIEREEMPHDEEGTQETVGGASAARQPTTRRRQ